MKSEPRNYLLRKLPSEKMDRILEEAEFIHLDIHDPVMESQKALNYVDFPESGVISVVTEMGKGKFVEIANVGREGFIGIPILLNVRATDEKAFCQVEATAWRISSKRFKELLDDGSELRSICEKYLATYLSQISRNGGCNWTHSIEERCARWLLMTQDRIDGDEFELTQEFLAMMLGVTRGGVNMAAGALAKAGLITYVRGKIKILDRARLEKATCRCYAATCDYYVRTIGPS